MEKRSKLIESVGFAVVVIGGLISLGAMVVASSTPLGSNDRQTAMESLFVGFFVMIIGAGVILSTLALASENRTWPSILAFTILLVGCLLGIGALTAPKLSQFSSEVLSVLYNIVLWFAFWLSILGVSVFVWILSRKQRLSKSILSRSSDT